jgi:hypothetical protein
MGDSMRIRLIRCSMRNWASPSSPGPSSKVKPSWTTVASSGRSLGRRLTVQDASHCPKRLQTTLTPAQEAVVMELRKLTLLPLDDLLSLVKE